MVFLTWFNLKRSVDSQFICIILESNFFAHELLLRFELVHVCKSSEFELRKPHKGMDEATSEYRKRFDFNLSPNL